MTREEDLQLLKLEMLRCAQIIDTVDFYSEPIRDKNGYRQYDWVQKMRSGRAELINKMHELRRDTMALEKQLLKLNI